MLSSPNHRLPVRLRRALTIVVLALCAAFILSLLSGISSALVHQLPHSFNPASLVPTAVTRFFERRNPPAKSVEATPLSPPAPMFFLAKTWGNTGTDYNTTGNWTGGTPGAGDVGQFAAAVVTQPNLSASLSNAGLYFSGTGSSGYDVTSSSAAVKFTFTGTGAT